MNVKPTLFADQPEQTPRASVDRAERALPDDVRQGEIGDPPATRIGLGVLAGAVIGLSAFGLAVFFQVMQNSSG